MSRKIVNKNRFITSIIVIFLVFLAVIFLFNKISGSSKADRKNAAEQVAEKEVIPDKSIRMTVAGDVLTHNTNYYDAYNASNDTYDFSYVYEDIQKYFDTADIAIGTLESNFAGKAKGYSNYPLFNAPEHLATDLKELGFDVLATGNNHCLDKGWDGMVNTLAELDKAGIEHFGTYATEEDSQKLFIKEVNGLKLGFAQYTYGTNGIAVPSDKKWSISMIDKEKIKKDLDGLKAENVDVIIVVMHWGEEYRLTANEEQKSLADYIFENGADLILGSHTHCLEPMEKREITLPDGTTKEGFIIYSLGNFMSGQDHANSRQSVLLDIKLTKKGDTGKLHFDYVTYTPTYMKNYWNGGNLRTPHKFKLLDIESEIAKYEAGDTSIGASLYNTLKKELQEIYSIVGEEINPEASPDNKKEETTQDASQAENTENEPDKQTTTSN